MCVIVLAFLILWEHFVYLKHWGLNKMTVIFRGLNVSSGFLVFASWQFSESLFPNGLFAVCQTWFWRSWVQMTRNYPNQWRSSNDEPSKTVTDTRRKYKFREDSKSKFISFVLIVCYIILQTIGQKLYCRNIYTAYPNAPEILSPHSPSS